jgi:hypothetical protein
MAGSITPVVTSQLADGTAAGSWVLDPAGSTAEFRVRHFWGARRPLARHPPQAAIDTGAFRSRTAPAWPTRPAPSAVTFRA